MTLLEMSKAMQQIRAAASLLESFLSDDGARTHQELMLLIEHSILKIHLSSKEN